MAAQIIFLMLWFGGLIVHSVKYLEPIKKEYNPIRFLFATSITHALLYWGGFYDVLLNN